MIQINIRFPHLLIALFALLALVIGGQVVAGQEDDPNAPAAVTVQLGSAFTYQGYLEEDDGPIDGQSCDFQFNLYDAADGATPLAGPLTRTAELFAGVFTVDLDFGDAFKGQARFLGIEARCPAGSGVYSALTPHQSLTAVPYAMSLRPGASIEGDVAPGRGALNLNSSQDGLSIGTAGDDGLAINRAGDTTVLCTINSESNGVEICSAENSGFSVGWVGEHGLSVGSAGQDGLFINSAAQEGVQVNEAGDIGLYIGSAGTDGLHVNSAGDEGVEVVAAAGHGVSASTTSNANYGGYFANSGATGADGAGLYALGNRNQAADIILGGSSNADDDGIIRSDPAYSGSDIFLTSNDAVIVALNADGDVEDADFQVINESNEIIFGVSDDGLTSVQVLKITGGADLSEQFDVTGDVQSEVKPGTVVCIDANNPGRLVICQQANDPSVAGVISGAGGVRPGMMMGQTGSVADGQYPVALAGRVYVWADAGENAIEPGDLLTTSSRPGMAAAVSDRESASGTILGKALTALPKGQGLVLLLITLQ